MTTRILITESRRFSARAAELLSQVGEPVFADLDRKGLLAAADVAEVLWVRLRNRIDREVMNAAPSLQIIVTPTTGLNHIDTAEAEDRGIQVLSLRGQAEFLQNVYGTAEHTIALMLALVRHLPAAARHAQRGLWNRDLFRGSEVHGKTAGIVGYGRLGRMVGRLMRDFGMRVLVWDPYVGSDAADPGVTFAPLAELLRGSDVVSLHASLTDQSRGFFGAAEFGLMKPDACFINTARGELIDEAALLDALSQGRLAGAALDVLTDEDSNGMAANPIVEYARTHENVIITPHIGGCTAESCEKTECFLAEMLATTLRQRMNSARILRLPNPFRMAHR